MKGLSHVVIGSIAGALLGAAAFFAIDGLIPKGANADTLYRSPLHDSPLHGGPAYRGGGGLITKFQITASTGTLCMTVSCETGMETPTTATR